MSQSSIVFGTGKIYTVPTKENPTPVLIGDVIDLMVDINQPLKSLISDKQFPIAIARGPANINLKAKLAVFNGNVLRDLLFGVNADAGNKILVDNEQVVVPAIPGPFTVTVAQAANFDTNLGVTDQFGISLTRVDELAILAEGQYSVDEATGVYTFSEDDAGKTFFISYHAIDATGTTINVKNQLMGFQPVFQISVDLVDPTNNAKKINFTFNRVVAAKLAFSLVNEDFAKPDLEMQAFADELGNVFSLGTSV